MLDHSDGWMGGWMHGGMGGSMWIWSLIGVVVLFLLVVVILKMAKK